MPASLASVSVVVVLIVSSLLLPPPFLLDNSLIIVSSFSTTNQDITKAYEIALMNTAKGYYDYEVFSFCGIPEITVEGTIADWNKIKENLKYLRRFDLDWWINELDVNAIKHFIEVANATQSNVSMVVS